MVQLAQQNNNNNVCDNLKVPLHQIRSAARLSDIEPRTPLTNIGNLKEVPMITNSNLLKDYQSKDSDCNGENIETENVQLCKNSATEYALENLEFSNSVQLEQIGVFSGESNKNIGARLICSSTETSTILEETVEICVEDEELFELLDAVDKNVASSSENGFPTSIDNSIDASQEPESQVENDNYSSFMVKDGISVLDHNYGLLNETPSNQALVESEKGTDITSDITLSNDPNWLPEPEDETQSDVSDDQELAEEQIISQNNIQNGDNNERIKRKRRKTADPKDWMDFKNKKRRELGENYAGWTKLKGEKGVRGAPRSERKMGPTCNSNHCKKTRDCQKFTERDREVMFNFFWKKMNWDQKKVYVTSLVSSVAPKRRTVEKTENNRRNYTLQYRLKTQDNKILKVCKNMYLSTLGLKEWMVLSWVKNASSGMSESLAEKNETRRHKPNAANRDGLIKFLDELPKLPSHYCRQSTSKVYLEPTFGNNMSDIYREYVKKCKDFNPTQIPVSRFTFDMVVKEKNIAFQPPKKDRCDLCIGYETNNIEEEKYQEHQLRKNKARDAKEEDKKAGEEGKCTVLTMDLQSVKVCPSLNASALYYKTKLCVHNFTVFNINNRHCRCYWFDETEADLTANTFASCLVDYLLDTVGENKAPIIIWSDGCTYQNRNATLSNALLAFSVDQGITVIQKYLEKGHTQMEADSVHATIEKKIKNKQIYLPSDYTRLTLEARQTPQPYEVKSVNYTFCKNYGESMVYPSIRPGKSAGDPQVTDIKSMKYTADGIIQVKLDFSEDFIDLPIRRKRPAVKSLITIPQLHSRKIPIKKQKWLHLQQLKQVIPADCHLFYDNLPHE